MAAGSVEAKVVMPAHLEVFSRFRCWEGLVPEGFAVNFLGVLRRNYFWEPGKDAPPVYPADRPVRIDYPAVEGQYLEWATVLEAVLAAEKHFTMMELGAGYGCWTANAAAAIRQTSNLPYTFVAVEADPTHFQWMLEHFKDNGLDEARLRAVQAAVTATDGQVGFYAGKERTEVDVYDQKIGGTTLVDAVSLATLLAPLKCVDLIHIDVQGAELDVLRAGAEDLDAKVMRVCIGTHNRLIDEGLRSLFSSLGWKVLRDYPCFATSETECGPMYFGDGLQVWLNPGCAASQTEATEVYEQKLLAARQESARLWNELVKARENQLIPGSLGSRMIERGRRLREVLAPTGSRRRKVLEAVSGKI